MSTEPLILLLITGVTGLILIVFLKYSQQINEKLIYFYITIGLYIYSGYGIAYTNVDNRYTIKFFIFLICILASFKLTVGAGRKRHIVLFTAEDIEKAVVKTSNIIKVFAFVYLGTLLVYLITPIFRLQEIFLPPISNAVGIHARSANKNAINRFADTLNIALLPFFLIYLQSLADRKKKHKYFIMTAAWIYLEYLQLGYLSRYQMMIYLLFIIFSIEINTHGEVLLDRKTRIIVLISTILSIPLLVAFVSFRSGLSGGVSSFSSSLLSLIDGETYYPIYYERISNNSNWGIKPSTFVTWILCLPIPSFLWSNKPFVDPSYALTVDLIGMISKTDYNYYNSLPSILGESMMIFGNDLYFLEAIIIGFFIGLFFRVLFRSKRLNTLCLYMSLMLLTLGRGGATSYMSVIINGTILMTLWVIVFNYRKNK